MADFCKQCSEKIFGEDFHEMAGISTEEDTKNQLYANVLCEGCGPIQVDHTGACINKDCLEQGHTGIKCLVVEKWQRQISSNNQVQNSQSAPELLADLEWKEFEESMEPLQFDDDPFEDYQGSDDDENS